MPLTYVAGRDFRHIPHGIPHEEAAAHAVDFKPGDVVPFFDELDYPVRHSLLKSGTVVLRDTPEVAANEKSEAPPPKVNRRAKAGA